MFKGQFAGKVVIIQMNDIADSQKICTKLTWISMQHTVAVVELPYREAWDRPPCHYIACSLHNTAILAITEKTNILSPNLGSESGLQHARAALVIRPNILPAKHVMIRYL